MNSGRVHSLMNRLTNHKELWVETKRKSSKNQKPKINKRILIKASELDWANVPSEIVAEMDWMNDCENKG